MRDLNDIRQIQGRTRILLIFVTSAILFCVIAYWFVQIVRGTHYQVAAENNQYRVNRIHAPRGKLLDRTGQIILVDNRPSFNLYIVPEKSESLRADIEILSEKLVLSDEEKDEIVSRAATRLSFQPLLVKEDIPFELMAFYEARKNLYPWVQISVGQKRTYPYKNFASHLLGRVGEISERQLKQEKFTGLLPGTMVGQSGLEYQYQDRLQGKDGNYIQVRNSRGRVIQEVSRENPVTGQDLLLTLDFDLQKKAEDLFTDKAGTLVALDVKTGEVLAMVSAPGFDPNQYAVNFSELVEDEASPLLNRAISSTFSPGSVWKGLMSIAGLREGMITPEEKVFCGGSVFLANRHWRDNGYFGWIALETALTKSSNVYFYKLGNKLGIDKIIKWQRRMGFGRPTGIDLPNEKSGLVPGPELMQRLHGRPWYPADTISLSIGQGDLLVTPLQLSVYMSAISNGGKLVQPHLVRGTKDEDGSISLFPIPQSGSIGVGDALLAHVRKGLWGVVNNNGTAPRARIPEISIAGKTGTAQVVDKRFWRDDMPEELRHHVWFVCFAPYENPEIAVTVFVEHGMNSSRVAVPVATEFLRTYAAVRKRLGKQTQTQLAE